MYDYFKSHSVACSNASRLVVINAVLMSIIFQHYKQLTKIDGSKKGARKSQVQSPLTYGHKQKTGKP